MKRISFFIIYLIAAAVIVAMGCGMQSSRRPKVTPMVVTAGTVLPTVGVGFDVYYDPQLDNIVPGYKILTVAYKNNSMNIIQMNPSDDMWEIEDRRGKRVKAIINLRTVDPDVWAGLPQRLKILMEYPLLIQIGSTQTIDLLFPEKINLGEFRSVTFRSRTSKQGYKIMPREN